MSQQVPPDADVSQPENAPESQEAGNDEPRADESPADELSADELSADEAQGPDDPGTPARPWLNHPHVPSGKPSLLALGALGVVFGDIGTSPLYAMQTVFSIDHNTVAPTPLDVYGIISMVFWSITLVVTVKYVGLVMRADNEGEGGILALVALLRARLLTRPALVAAASVMGIVGAALFYGDSVITPAISVMSAIEGITIVSPSAEQFVLPASIAILTVLFASQRFGTEKVGRAFGPVMLAWFVALAAMGVPKIVAHPQILGALSPHRAVLFAVDRPFVAFVAMGAVVLTITGAEALYADMGHFGSRAIRTAWAFVVFPSLLLHYLGQGAMILVDPGTSRSPFFHMAPAWARIPLVVLATMATVIASQAVISGAFSVSQQAARLSLLPRMNVRHTSREEGGQIYIGSINWMLFIGVLVLVLTFGSSAKLATAYGLAVTGTLILTTCLFLFLARHVWGWSAWRMVLATVVIGGVEVLFFSANLTKVASGGWLPLLIATALVTVMLTWRWGARLVTERRQQLEGPLDEFLETVRTSDLPRVPGVAVYPHPNQTTTPLAFRDNLRFNGVVHEHVVIVTIVTEMVPHIHHVERAEVDDLGDSHDGITHVAYHVGFNDTQNVPGALQWAKGKNPELDDFDVDQCRYFMSVVRLQHDGPFRLRDWRTHLFMWLAASAANRASVFGLPPDRTVIMGAHVDL
ncbi:potassium transporter Kup [Aestuariimicrobium sp. T2.26MG-19.2B]|uniref:potassium transporter Kup n=1 Tax=Aestuariimicrobium sp. T2.26MG-19.2B TaxID=3040679 RepID=UPI0025401E44|nr:potassium transporter Kup [Aestuariimicrobium sp. T2.26MG-19.2B]